MLSAVSLTRQTLVPIRQISGHSGVSRACMRDCGWLFKLQIKSWEEDVEPGKEKLANLESSENVLDGAYIVEFKYNSRQWC